MKFKIFASAVIAVLFAYAGIHTAGIGFGVTGAVKRQVEKIDKRVKEEKEREASASSAGTGTSSNRVLMTEAFESYSEGAFPRGGKQFENGWLVAETQGAPVVSIVNNFNSYGNTNSIEFDVLSDTFTVNDVQYAKLFTPATKAKLTANVKTSNMIFTGIGFVIGNSEKADMAMLVLNVGGTRAIMFGNQQGSFGVMFYKGGATGLIDKVLDYMAWLIIPNVEIFPLIGGDVEPETWDGLMDYLETKLGTTAEVNIDDSEFRNYDIYLSTQIKAPVENWHKVEAEIDTVNGTWEVSVYDDVTGERITGMEQPLTGTYDNQSLPGPVNAVVLYGNGLLAKESYSIENEVDAALSEINITGFAIDKGERGWIDNIKVERLD